MPSPLSSWLVFPVSLMGLGCPDWTGREVLAFHPAAHNALSRAALCGHCSEEEEESLFYHGFWGVWLLSGPGDYRASDHTGCVVYWGFLKLGETE